ncbi:threonine/serine exporter family protein, partial [Blautia hominis]|nr:threonine/serine exporter family protein [Blautia hominis]
MRNSVTGHFLTVLPMREAVTIKTVAIKLPVPKEHYPLCGTIGGLGWLICWICTNPFHMSAVTGS